MIKHQFFHDAELVECAYSVRLLFVGLWTLADREGRLVDKPKQIKMDLFPADDIDVDAGLQELHERGFILRYEAEGQRLILVKAFRKHQTPHRDEKDSTLPAPGEQSAGTVPASGDDAANPTRILNLDNQNLDGLRLEARALEPESAAGAPRASKRRRSEIDPAWEPDRALTAWTETEGWDRARMEREIPQFRDHHLKTGSTMADWPAAWRTWVRRGIQMDADRGRPIGVPPAFAEPALAPIPQPDPAELEALRRRKDEADRAWEEEKAQRAADRLAAAENDPRRLSHISPTTWAGLTDAEQDNFAREWKTG